MAAIETPGAAARTATLAYRAARDSLLSCHDDPDRARREFCFPDVGDVFNWAHDWFDPVARGNTRPALVIVEEDGSRSAVSFDELAVRSDRLARWMRGEGIARGDPVVLMLGNQVELWESMLALMKLGAVVVPTTTALGPSDLEDRIARSGARVVVCNPADAAKFAGVPGGVRRMSTGAVEGWADMRDAGDADASPLPHPGTAAHDPLLLYFTSGTTSRPKLVEHTQTSYPVGHLSTMYWIGLRPGDVHCNVSSPGWAKHAWSCVFAPWAAEATVFVYNYARFDAASLLTHLREGDVTTFCAPPTVWRMLVTAELGPRPPALRELVSAGEPLNPEVIAQVSSRWGITVRDGYGQTETTASIGNPPSQPVKPGSMGRPLPGVPVVVVDVATGARVDGVGEGEICLDLGASPRNLMAGYRDDDGAAMALGVYHTGDVASVDEDGYITFIGRTDDVFKSSDYKVSPFEVESVLIEHPLVAEAAVVPSPDPVRLAVPKAYVVLVPGASPTRDTALSILLFARERLAPYKRVRRLEFFDLPKTISGKIRRVELREREDAASGRTGAAEWREEQFPELRS